MVQVPRHSPSAASRPAALRLVQIQPVFSLAAPCRPGASLVSVRRGTCTTGCSRTPVDRSSRDVRQLASHVRAGGRRDAQASANGLVARHARVRATPRARGDHRHADGAFLPDESQSFSCLMCRIGSCVCGGPVPYGTQRARAESSRQPEHGQPRARFRVDFARLRLARGCRCPSATNRSRSCALPHTPGPTDPGRGVRAPPVPPVLGGRAPICRRPWHLCVR